MASNAGKMTLTADGSLILGQVQSAGPVRATSRSATVRAERTIFSDNTIVLQGMTAVEIAEDALVASQDDVSVLGNDISLGQGAIVAAGTNRDGAMTQSGSLSLVGDTINAGEGRLLAGTAIALEASVVDLSRDATDADDNLRALGDVTITADDLTATNGQIRAGDDLTIVSNNNLTVVGGDYASVGGLTVSGASVAMNATLNTKGTAAMHATTGSVTNNNHVAGDARAVVTAQTLIFPH